MGNASHNLGSLIRDLRVRLGKSQAEFATLLGSQQNSISRYEKGKVEPSVTTLWKLYNLAEADAERAQLGQAIQLQIGRLYTGQDVYMMGSMEALKPLIDDITKAEGLRALNPKSRPDIARLLLYTFDFAVNDGRVDDSLIELIGLWRRYGDQPRARAVLKEIVADFRSRMEAAPSKAKRARSLPHHSIKE